MFIAPITAEVRTTCPYCGVGCGVLASAPSPRLRGEGASPQAQTCEVKGDPAHPATAARLCSKGSALAETLGTERRLLVPEISARRPTFAHTLHLPAPTFPRPTTPT